MTTYIKSELTRIPGFFIIVCFLFQSFSADAIVINFSDFYNPDPDVLIAFGNDRSFSFTHSLIADQDDSGSLWSGLYGFDPLNDSISFASLSLRFRDESADTAAESVSFIFDLQSYGSHTITSGGGTFVSSITGGWGNFLDDGILNIDISNAGTTSGSPGSRSDFLFMDSMLSIRVVREDERLSQVPLPPTLALFSLGLAGLFWTRVRLTL